MTNFIGDHICRLDTKGRIMLPATLKKQLSGNDQDRFVIKKDIFAKCLVLYPMEEWERQNKFLRAKINPYNREHTEFVRAFYKGAAEINLDGNNRLLIPKRMIEEIDIDKEVVLTGQFNKIEIWPKDGYDKIADSDEEFASLAEKILGGLNTETYE